MGSLVGASVGGVIGGIIVGAVVMCLGITCVRYYSAKVDLIVDVGQRSRMWMRLERRDM